MTYRQSTAVRDAKNNAVETTTGTAPLIRTYGGSEPASCAAAESGSVLAQGTLPSDWLSASSSGVKSKAGTWTLTGQAAAGSGTAQTHCRIYDSTGTTCHHQYTITATGGGGEMELDNVSVANAQSITISVATLTAGNA